MSWIKIKACVYVYSLSVSNGLSKDRINYIINTSPRMLVNFWNTEACFLAYKIRSVIIWHVEKFLHGYSGMRFVNVYIFQSP